METVSGFCLFNSWFSVSFLYRRADIPGPSTTPFFWLVFPCRISQPLPIRNYHVGRGDLGQMVAGGFIPEYCQSFTTDTAGPVVLVYRDLHILLVAQGKT